VPETRITDWAIGYSETAGEGFRLLLPYMFCEAVPAGNTKGSCELPAASQLTVMLFLSTGLRCHSIIIVIIVGETYRFERFMTGELRGFII
jgi:hypothetical protein